MNHSATRTMRILVILAGCVAIGAADPSPCYAQRLGGTKGKGKGGKKPPKTTGEVEFDRYKQQDAPSGSDYGEIRKFTPKNSDKDPDLLGLLMIKPFDPKTPKAVTLRVLREKDYKFSIGGHAFTSEEMAEMLTRGLQCTAKWKLEGDPAGASDAKKKSTRPKRKELVSLEFRPFEVEGELVKVEGDIVELRVRPKSNTEWPDEEYKQRNQRAPVKKATKPKLRKLRLKIYEDSTKLLNSTDASIDLADLQSGQTIQASAVLSAGRGVGVLESLKATDQGPETAGDEATKPDEGSTRRGGDEGGNRTRRG